MKVLQGIYNHNDDKIYHAIPKSMRYSLLPEGKADPILRIYLPCRIQSKIRVISLPMRELFE